LKITARIYIIIAFLAGVSWKFINAQQINTPDSLQAIQKLDTTTINYYLKKGRNYQYSKLDSALYFHKLLLEKLNKHPLPEASANSYYRVKIIREIGWDYYLMGEFDKSIASYEQGIAELKQNKIAELSKKELYTAHFEADLGTVYMQMGEFKSALHHLFEGLKNYDKVKNKSGQSSSNLNIGIIYYYLKNFDKALQYLEIAKQLNEEINDIDGTGNILIMMGAIQLENESFDLAIESFNEALSIQENIGNNAQINACLANLGMAHRKKGNLNQAITYYDEALKLAKETKNTQVETIQLINLGTIYSELGNCKKSIFYFSEALPLAHAMNSKKELEALHKNISDAHYHCGDYKTSLYHYQQYITYRDSLFNENTDKLLFEKELKYSFDKKATADSVANAKAQEIKDSEIARQRAEKSALLNQQLALYGGLFLVLIFTVFLYNRFKITQKQRDIINLQKLEVEKQKEILQQQKHVIEEKHKEITDSINYAERIQRSFLASKSLLDEALVDYFVFFRPKDVVSGDFYWASPLPNDSFAFCCADSTGHGVPGAIMSLLNIASIEKAIEKYSEPHHILNETRRIIIERLKKDGSPEGGKDGMDCSLIILNAARTKMTFAAAHNPVWVVRNNELIEFKADKMPVGKHDKDQNSFVLQEFDLQQHDIIYTFTDGFPDQFGGPKGKKFMHKSLKELLLDNAQQPMQVQHNILSETLQQWKGNLEQIDDICIIGVRI
jgi:serine phosphatase RsbU (regulator of sigma subunit)